MKESNSMTLVGLDSDRDQVLLPARAAPGLAVVEVLREVSRVHLPLCLACTAQCDEGSWLLT